MEVRIIVEYIDHFDLFMLMGLQEVIKENFTYEVNFGPDVKKSFIKTPGNRENR